MKQSSSKGNVSHTSTANLTSEVRITSYGAKLFTDAICASLNQPKRVTAE